MCLFREKYAKLALNSENYCILLGYRDTGPIFQIHAGQVLIALLGRISTKNEEKLPICFEKNTPRPRAMSTNREPRI